MDYSQVDLHDNKYTVEYNGKLRVLDMMLYQLHSQVFLSIEWLTVRDVPILLAKFLA